MSALAYIIFNFWIISLSCSSRICRYRIPQDVGRWLFLLWASSAKRQWTCKNAESSVEWQRSNSSPFYKRFGRLL